MHVTSVPVEKVLHACSYFAFSLWTWKKIVVPLQVARKLAEAQRELQAAEAAGAIAEQAMHASERHKKWLKF